ncbi:MAG: BPSS1780 family membrane protein [Betaproteobacteria bacterium]|nr:BPSS1780 family membrane protein [Betaproteobacteria bacterium]
MTTNPYSAPVAKVADVAAPLGKFIPGGRAVAAGQGWTWFTQGWDLFRRQPALWIGMTVTLFVILLALAFIPLLGPLANSLLWPVLVAGLLIGCRALAEGGNLEFGHLFAGFRERFGTLIGVGAIAFGISLAIGILVAAVMGLGMFALVAGRPGPGVGPQAQMTMALPFLVMMALLLPLFMALWFAPPLVAFHERGPVEAMKESFTGCLKNIVPFLVYGLIGLVLSILASIPFGLGWLVLGPVLIASVYASYRDIYLEA